MGHRLSRIYTRTGDAGSTGLADGTRIGKDAERIEAIGTLDEANSAIGFLLTQSIDSASVRTTLIEIQHKLFDAGAELSLPGHVAIRSEHVEQLEPALDELNSGLPPLKEFVLPGGTPAAAAWARCNSLRACRAAGNRAR